MYVKMDTGIEWKGTIRRSWEKFPYEVIDITCAK